jgi:glutathione synthase/RimK-type ligase-like ATP-grasp enzyme
MIDITLITARSARELDEDLAPLYSALEAAGLNVAIAAWDEPFDYRETRLALLRSTWDYTERLQEFSAWLDATSALTTVLNPSSVVRFSLDKHYLADLQRHGVPIIPSRFIEPGQRFSFDELDEFVVKPCVGAGSRGARRFAGGEFALATEHANGLLAQGFSVLVQPYLKAVDHSGETALIFFNGVYSHAIRKAALLDLSGAAVSGLFKPESITAREAQADEIAVAQKALAAVPHPGPLAYARVDLIRAHDGSPQLLELELAEPSVFLSYAPGSAQRFAESLKQRLESSHV